jgi:hypothetical protein
MFKKYFLIISTVFLPIDLVASEIKTQSSIPSSLVTKSGKSYTNVILKEQTDEYIRVLHDSGINKILISDLPDEIFNKISSNLAQPDLNVINWENNIYGYHGTKGFVFYLYSKEKDLTTGDPELINHFTKDPRSKDFVQLDKSLKNSFSKNKTYYFIGETKIEERADNMIVRPVKISPDGESIFKVNIGEYINMYDYVGQNGYGASTNVSMSDHSLLSFKFSNLDDYNKTFIRNGILFKIPKSSEIDAKKISIVYGLKNLRAPTFKLEKTITPNYNSPLGINKYFFSLTADLASVSVIQYEPDLLGRASQAGDGEMGDPLPYNLSPVNVRRFAHIEILK